MKLNCSRKEPKVADTQSCCQCTCYRRTGEHILGEGVVFGGEASGVIPPERSATTSENDSSAEVAHSDVQEAEANNPAACQVEVVNREIYSTGNIFINAPLADLEWSVYSTTILAYHNHTISPNTIPTLQNSTLPQPYATIMSIYHTLPEFYHTLFYYITVSYNVNLQYLTRTPPYRNLPKAMLIYHNLALPFLPYSTYANEHLNVISRINSRLIHEDCDEEARLQRAREIEVGVEAPPNFRPVRRVQLLYSDEHESGQAPRRLQLVCPPDLTVDSLRAFFQNRITLKSCPLDTITGCHTQVDFIHCLVPDLQQITNSSFYWGRDPFVSPLVIQRHWQIARQFYTIW